MREVKFRAQDQQGIWWYSDNRMRVGFYCNAAIFWRGIETGTLKKETLGEFTGLRDKNDTEIWEGDVVSGNIGGVVVEFDNAAFRVRRIRTENIIMLLDEYILSNGEKEVLGNIYENGGLLK